LQPFCAQGSGGFSRRPNTVAVFKVDPTSGDMTFLTDRDVCASPRFSKMALIQ
jgi:hypothetical protein